jgi:hypothetical protein
LHVDLAEDVIDITTPLLLKINAIFIPAKIFIYETTT